MSISIFPYSVILLYTVDQNFFVILLFFIYYNRFVWSYVFMQLTAMQTILK